jgi:hypothetical protein
LSNGISNSTSRFLIFATTIVLGLAAIVLIFAPAETADWVGISGQLSVPLILQLYGAALFGLAMTGWMVKDSIVGGVFGRSYVAGNAAHAFVGFLVLVRPALVADAHTGIRIIACVYLLLAVLFGYLMFVAAPRS